jgi:hypothetical protein
MICRTQISALWAAIGGSIREQANHDLGCTESSVQLKALRREMACLIAERNALGGRETFLIDHF